MKDVIAGCCEMSLGRVLRPCANFTFFTAVLPFLVTARFLFFAAGLRGTPSGLPLNMYSDAWNQPLLLGVDFLVLLPFAFFLVTFLGFFLSLASLFCIASEDVCTGMR